MSVNVEALLRRIRFTSTTIRSMDDRIHYLTEEDVRTLLRRLPPRTWARQFDHPDSIHNRPDEDELKQVDTGLLLHAG
jgi:hypothetical protein